MAKVYPFGSSDHLMLIGKRLIVAGLVIVTFVVATTAADKVNAPSS